MNLREKASMETEWAIWKRALGIRESWEDHTGGIGQFILATLDLVLQTLSFAPGRSNLGLHLFAGHIGHFAGPLESSCVEGDGVLST
jgi:hypothetical protein